MVRHPDAMTLPMAVSRQAASLSNLSALDHMCRGYKIADLIAIGGSLDYVIPDIDR